jgi:hypothetical protein
MIIEYNGVTMDRTAFPVDPLKGNAGAGHAIGPKWADIVTQGLREFAAAHAGLVADALLTIRFETGEE